MCIRDRECIVPLEKKTIFAILKLIIENMAATVLNSVQQHLLKMFAFDGSEAVSYTHLDVYKRQLQSCVQKKCQAGKFKILKS